MMLADRTHGVGLERLAKRRFSSCSPPARRRSRASWLGTLNACALPGRISPAAASDSPSADVAAAASIFPEGPIPEPLVTGLPLPPASHAFLSPRIPIDWQCRRWWSGVNSKNSNCPTSTGFGLLTPIFAVVSPTPHPPLLPSGWRMDCTVSNLFNLEQCGYTYWSQNIPLQNGSKSVSVSSIRLAIEVYMVMRHSPIMLNQALGPAFRFPGDK
jgi:hypothetical protein